jgi:hypothetical protein
MFPRSTFPLVIVFHENGATHENSGIETVTEGSFLWRIIHVPVT